MSDEKPMPAGLSPYDSAALLRQRIAEANGYARERKRQFRRGASGMQILTLVLSAASTVILGLQDLDPWAGFAFALVAVTAVLNGVEPFFNWRSRWVLAEEAQHRFYRLQEDLEHLVSTTPATSLTTEAVQSLYERYATIWDEFSRQWLEHRRASGERS